MCRVSHGLLLTGSTSGKSEVTVQAHTPPQDEGASALGQSWPLQSKGGLVALVRAELPVPHAVPHRVWPCCPCAVPPAALENLGCSPLQEWHCSVVSSRRVMENLLPVYCMTWAATTFSVSQGVDTGLTRSGGLRETPSARRWPCAHRGHTAPVRGTRHALSPV